ncbi:hypothetical protein L208DRAFT_1339240, partial [Tricholoma matsutake]
GQPKPLAKGNPKLKLYYIIQALGTHLAKGNLICEVVGIVMDDNQYPKFEPGKKWTTRFHCSSESQ